MKELEAQAAETLSAVLGRLFGSVRSLSRQSDDFDLFFKAKNRRFAVEVKGQSSTPALLAVWRHLQKVRPADVTPILAMPIVTAKQQVELERSGVNWVDFAGNAHVRDGELLIHIEGLAPIARRGRRASVFERRSSRVVRALLLQPHRSWSLVDAAATAGLDAGHTSRILRRLQQDGFLERGAKREFRLLDPIQLAEAWRDAADFEANTIHPVYVLGRSGSEVTETLATALRSSGARHAATGLSAAWAYDHFAMFRVSTFYVDRFSSDLALSLGVEEKERSAANVWLVEPSDDGVFEGMRMVDGLACVHPLQVWIDLKGHAERAPEAADHMKTEALLGFRP